MSYTQIGNNDNPFVYSATPLSIKMPNGSADTITNQTNKTAAKTTLSLYLDNFGDFVSAGTSPDFSINGHVVIAGTTYDGTLLQAQAQEFGYSNTITTADAEFDVRLTITGGLLTQSGGPYNVGDSLGAAAPPARPDHRQLPGELLGDQQPDGHLGHVAPAAPAVLPVHAAAGDDPDPTADHRPQPESRRSPIRLPIRRAGVRPAAPARRPPRLRTGNLSDTISQDDGNGTVALYDGSVTMQTTDLTIPGRGLDYDLTMTYRSDVVGTDACCGGWEMSYSRRLVVVDPNNLAEYQAAFPAAKVGDVDQVDDNDRDDLYVQNGSSYISPAGYYSQLLKNPDGSYTERFADGTVYDYSRPDAMGVATLKSESDANGDTMQFVYNDQEQLTTVYDTLGRPIQYSYNTAGQLTQVQDYMGRTVTFGYDANGDLTSVTSPRRDRHAHRQQLRQRRDHDATPTTPITR